ncbi:hypothetical protein AURDEDRAFT_155143, partial [Auricularia subglabra TFB-10046 SS5]
MTTAMDRVPDELVLHILDSFGFNELQPALSTCSRWRALAQRCPAFWRDIQTPGSAEPNLDAATKLACARLEATNGRRFTLRLQGAYPEILSVVAQHMHHLEYLDAQIGSVDELSALNRALRLVQAPLLGTFRLTFGVDNGSEDEAPNFGTLSPGLFSGAACPLLTRVMLADVALPRSSALPCFSAVTELRLLHNVDFLSAVTPDVFMHFPAVKSLSLGAPVMDIGSGFTEEQLEIIERFRTADYSQIEHIELLGQCWDLAEETAWPLEQIPHVFAESEECTSLPFLPSPLFKIGHIVLEPHEDE